MRGPNEQHSTQEESRLQSEEGSQNDTGSYTLLTPERAQELLNSIPSRPRRRLSLRDHLWAIATIALSLASGLLALTGSPWWAILPGVAALIVADNWFSHRKRRTNEPRFGAVQIVFALFGVWLTLPIYRGIRFGDTAPFPEALILGGLAPAAWLVFYLWLLIRR
ncbi:MAG: hypothetical protein ACTHWM_08290 [Yaniella sp.]|uniref:hypothetical protein n=1 Tax=Yaniella sp. TaxID=2773929 RepID=UPI003F971C95